MAIHQQTTVVRVAPRIGSDGFARILRAAESPAAAEAAEGWDVVTSYGIDPLFALAIFHKESQFGRDGVCFNYQTRSPGNTRTSRTGVGTPVETEFRQFIRYPTWTEGWRDLAFRLVDPDFVYAQQVLQTIRPVIFTWAPPSDFGQDTERYVADVVRNMTAWQDVPCVPVRPPAFDGTDKLVGNVRFHAAGQQVEVAVDGLHRHQFADPASCDTGEPLARGASFGAAYWVEGTEVDGERRWWVTAAGDRIWAGGTQQQPGAGVAAAAGQASTLPPNYVGTDDHPPIPKAAAIGVQRALGSPVWGGYSAHVTSEHGASCGYCGETWPRGVGMPPFTHPGMDIGIVRGTALFAAAGGRVAFADFDPRYYRPYHVDIVTDDGQHHIYAHMWSIAPSLFQGGRVARGQYLGTSGQQTNPGTMEPDDTGAHLHFEARVIENNWERAIDPEPILMHGIGGAFCQPAAPPSFDGQEHRVNDVLFHPYWRTIEVSVDGLGCYQWADLSSCATRELLQRGELFEARYWIEGTSIQGERRWWVSDRGDRIWAGGTIQKPD
jgi:murein DD-endopeptidase MepM/ murein hydrolase activator NlpD